jgi:hypothetical protein
VFRDRAVSLRVFQNSVLRKTCRTEFGTGEEDRPFVFFTKGKMGGVPSSLGKDEKRLQNSNGQT